MSNWSEVMNKNRNKAMIKFIVLLIFSIIVLYPLVWMIMSSFKEESTIFSNLEYFLQNSSGRIIRLDGNPMEELHLVLTLRILLYLPYFVWLEI